MSSFDRRTVARLLLVTGLAGLTAGCFQPMYGDHNVVATAGLSDKLGTIDVPRSAPRTARGCRASASKSATT